jgi:hypothetical protein
MMQKSLWIIAVLLLLVVAGASNAQATSFTYSYTFTVEGTLSLAWTTSPLPGVTTDTSIAAGALASSTVGGALGGQTLNSVALDPLSTPTSACSTGDCVVSFLSGASGTTEIIFPKLTASDFTTPGSYTFSANAAQVVETLTVRAAAMPEPPTYGLLLIGIALVFLMWRRTAQGLPQAG